MNKSSLVDRMRKQRTRYEEASKTYLMRGQPVIIRIDGNDFHTFTKGFKSPWDGRFHQVMNNTMVYLCENIQGCVLGYTQSDEISLLLCDYQKLDTDAWFSYDVQKIVSVTASMATIIFNKFFTYEALELSTASSDELDGLSDDEINEFYAYMDAFDNAVRKGVMFDSIAFNIPKEEVNNYFLWRQRDCERNSIQGLAQTLYSHKQIEGISNKDLQNKMFTDKGVNWNDCPTEQKRGVCCVYGKCTHDWYTDYDIPIFSVRPDYINSRIIFDDSEGDENE